MTDQQGGRRRPDASMTLLTAVMEKPLDPGYAAVAQQRKAGLAPDPSPRRRIATLLLAVVLGLGIITATQQLRAPAPEGTSARAVMVEQIRERDAAAEELRTNNDELREEISDLQSQVLGEEAEAFLARTELLRVAVGTVEVQGPGLVITLEDSASAAAGEPDAEDGRVQDFDVQVVVNALWASGAEAIAVNGHRLTNLTAIRSAGGAILVDLQPLVPPYRVEAIGDPEAMRTQFARSSGQGHLSALSSAFSIPSSVEASSDLHLPAASGSQLRYAEPNQ